MVIPCKQVKVLLFGASSIKSRLNNKTALHRATGDGVELSRVFVLGHGHWFSITGKSHHEEMLIRKHFNVLNLTLNLQRFLGQKTILRCNIRHNNKSTSLPIIFNLYFRNFYYLYTAIGSDSILREIQIQKSPHLLSINHSLPLWLQSQHQLHNWREYFHRTFVI